MNCPICGSEDIVFVTRRTNVPGLLNMLCDTQAGAREVPRGDIEHYMCKKCGFVFNKLYQQLNYSVPYNNATHQSSIAAAHMDYAVNRVASSVNSSKMPVLLVEIGCGQGDFLKRVISEIDEAISYHAIGFDPAYNGNDKIVNCSFISDVFTGGGLKHFLDGNNVHTIFVSRHVIEHIPNPDVFMREISSSASEHAEIFLETPDFRWTLTHYAFEDLGYEHCSLYTGKSLQVLLEKFGFITTRFTSSFDDQYLWCEAKKTLDSFNVCERFRRKESDARKKWTEMITSYNGIAFIWGAAGKGCSFLNFIDPECKLIAKAIDINKAKQGCYIPGTGHEIVGPEYLKEIREAKLVIIMNTIYQSEIKQQIDALGITDIKLLEVGNEC